MLEDSFVGCDILTAAVHLTAARLSGEQPADDNARTRTWVMPYGDTQQPAGGTSTRLSSIDLLDDDTQPALWGDGTIGVTPEGDTATVTADVPEESLDVVIMNPPFTRSVGHEGNRVGVPQPAFAGLGNSSQEQAKMAKLLKKASNMVRHRPTAYSGQVGLGSIFADLAHVKLKPGGVLALILPASAIAGKERANLRALLATAYEQIQVLSIAETGSGASSGSATPNAADQAPGGYGTQCPRLPDCGCELDPQPQVRRSKRRCTELRVSLRRTGRQLVEGHITSDVRGTRGQRFGHRRRISRRILSYLRGTAGRDVYLLTASLRAFQ